MDLASNRRYQRVRVTCGAHKESRIHAFLLTGLIDGHRWNGNQVGVVQVRHDANDAAPFGTEAGDLDDGIAPAHMPADGLLQREKPVNQTLTYDDDQFAVGPVAVVKIAAL